MSLPLPDGLAHTSEWAEAVCLTLCVPLDHVHFKDNLWLIGSCMLCVALHGA